MDARIAREARLENRLANPPQLYWMETTSDERTMATLAHALQLFGSWIAPLVIFLVRRQSRFVAFHALQALLLQIVHTIVMLLFVGGMFLTMILYIIPASGGNAAHFPTPLFLMFPLFWLVLITLSMGTLVIAIIYAIKAGRGEWADYPVLGRLARKMLKMAPNPGQPG
jgi:uncharacterized protein